MTLEQKIIDKASKLTKKIALPESDEPRIVKAVEIMLKKSNLRFVLFGDKNKLKTIIHGFDEKRIEVVDINNYSKISQYASVLYEKRKNKGVTEDDAKKLVKNPMMLATVMEEVGDVDGVVCGTVTHTANVLRPIFQVIKTKPNISAASSCVLFDVPKEHKYGKNGPVLFADCSVIPHPTSENLKDIALASCETYKKLVGGTPYVAFLSYSTLNKDKEVEDSIAVVKKAVELTKLADPTLDVDGEMQMDCALDTEVAKIKCPDSKVAGKANVFVFPDLNSANIAYKTVSRFAGFSAIGIILQGVNKPANDLSRGAEVNEICTMIAITALS